MNLSKKIWLSSPHMGGNELKYIKEAFKTNWIAPLGPNVDGFEKDLQEYTGAKYAAALSSGTAALHLALVLLGVNAGDEVICQSMTFSASANPIKYLGAVPVFIDSESLTWNMCPTLLRSAIKDRISKGKKPKAIIAVHLYGMPSQMDKILKIADEFNIPVIEDAAESLGSKIHGQHLGTFGIMGILSFNGNKIITTSGGGALISNNHDLVEKAKFLATQARDPAPHYQHSHIGYNYRLSNISAGIGRGQMEVIQERVNQRKQNFDFYRSNLREIEEINFLTEPKGYISNRWLTTITLNSKNSSSKMTPELLRLALNDLNIETRPLWKPMHLQPVFKNCPQYINGISEQLFNSGLCLPSGSNLKKTQLKRIVNNLKNQFKKL